MFYSFVHYCSLIVSRIPVGRLRTVVNRLRGARGLFAFDLGQSFVLKSTKQAYLRLVSVFLDHLKALPFSSKLFAIIFFSLALSSSLVLAGAREYQEHKARQQNSLAANTNSKDNRQGNSNNLIASLIANLFNREPNNVLPSDKLSSLKPTNQAVLAAETSRFKLTGNISFNIPSIFNSDLTAKKTLQVEGEATFKSNITATGANLDLGTGKLTAGNVVYSLTAGDGISISTGQTPTIKNTGVTSIQGSTGSVTFTAGTGISISGTTITNSLPGSDQKMWKTFTIGSTSISAGTNTDTFTFTEGTGITLTPDSSNKKLTIASSSTSGFTDGGTVVYLATTSDNLGIGTTTASNFKLELAGNIGVATDNTYDIGSSSYQFRDAYVGRNLYVTGNLVTTGSQAGLFQVSSRAISPANITDDLLLGATATSSALVKLTGTSGNNSFINTGNLGVGTTSPLAKLDVSGTASLSANLSLKGAGTAHTLNVLDDGTLNIQRSPGGDAGLATSLYISAVGNVGVGTTSPLAKLDVSGTASASGNLTFSGARTIVGTAMNTLTIGDSSTGNLVLNPGGNVGVATTTPTSFKMETAGSIGPSANNTYDLGSSSRQWNNVYGQNVYVAGNLVTTGSQAGLFQVSSRAISPANITDDLLLGATATSSALIKLTGTSGNNSFINTGNVGIGSTSPYSKLDVGGNITLSPTGGAPTIQIRSSATTNILGSTRYAYSNSITISNSSGSTMSQNVTYTLVLTGSDASTVYNASQTSGADVRIGYNGTEISRALDVFSSTQIYIRFAIQANIAASGSDNLYTIYYGNPSISAPTAYSSSTSLDDGTVGNWTSSDTSSISIATDTTNFTEGTASVKATVGAVANAGTFATTSQGQLPEARGSAHTSVTATIGGTTYIYVIGGHNGSNYVSTVYRSTIDSSGNAGTFATTSQAQLLQINGYHTSVTATIGGTTYIYVIGGFNGTGNFSTVYKSQIDTSANAGTFATTSQAQLPQSVRSLSAATATIGGTSYIYVISGYLDNNANISTVYKSQIDTSGNAGTFATTSQSQLPQVLHQPASVTATISGTTYLYVIGGFNNTSTFSTVYRSTLDTSGNTSAFATTSQAQLPQGIRQHTAVTATLSGTNYIYVLGGYNGSANLSTVYKSQIDTSANVGAFATTSQAQLPQILPQHAAVTATISNSTYIYTAGGNGSSVVYRSALSSPIGVTLTKTLSSTDLSSKNLISYWLQASDTATASNLVLEISNDGGSNWIPASPGNPSLSSVDTWKQQFMDITSAGTRNTVTKIRFRITGSISGTFTFDNLLAEGTSFTGSSSSSVGSQTAFNNNLYLASEGTGNVGIGYNSGAMGGFNIYNGATTALFTVLRGGNIGIGTTTPAALLDVQGAAQFGSGNVSLIDSTGKITGLSTTYFNTDTSSSLAGVITDEQGSGALVFATSPTLTTPTLGVATATTINKLTITAPTTSATLTIADGKTLTSSNTLTFTGTDSSSVAFGAGGTVAYTTNNLSVFAETTSAQLAGVISNETGTGVLVFGTAPTFTTSITDPLVIGGTGTTSTLTLRSTSGVGTTGADIIFQTGNNGATEAMRIINSGNVGVGTTSATRGLQLFGDNKQIGVSSANYELFTVGNAGGGAYLNRGYLTLRDAGTTEIAIDTSGPSYFNTGDNVGIGTTAPLALLDVAGTASASGNLSFSGARTIAGTAMNTLTIGNSSTGHLVLNPGGNVGIGTTAPTALLHLNRADTTRTDFFIENDDKTAGAEIGAFRFQALDSGDAAQIYAQIIGTIDTATAGSEVGQISFETWRGGDITAAMTIEGGNVGIGNATPGTLLDVAGTGSFFADAPSGRTMPPAGSVVHLFKAGQTTFGSGNQLLIGSANATGAYSQIGFGWTNAVDLTYAPGVIGFVATDASGNTKGDLVFGTRNATTDTAPTIRMRIDSAGSVGIGVAPNPIWLTYISSAMSGAAEFGLIRVQNGTGLTMTGGTSVNYYAYKSDAVPYVDNGVAAGRFAQMWLDSVTAVLTGSGTLASHNTLYLGTPVNGTTVRVIDTAAGAYLTTGGIWTDAPSWSYLKTNIANVPDTEIDSLYDWFRDSYQSVRYRYPGDQSYEYDHFGFLLDDMPQSIREIVMADSKGGIRSKDSIGLLFTLQQESARRLNELSASSALVVDASGNLNLQGMLNASSASVSGALTAKSMNVQTGNIDTLTVNKLIAGSIETTITDSSPSAIFNFKNQGIKLDFAEFDFTTIKTNLAVLGTTTLGDTTIQQGKLTIGGTNNLVITNNSIDSIGSDLAIQSLRQGGITLLGGIIKIDTDGNLISSASAIFAKDVKVGGVLSAESVAATGSATFGSLGLSQVVPKIVSDTEVIATGSAGVVVIKTNKIQLKINNQIVTEKSLIFVTSNAPLAGQSLYVKEKKPGESFTIGIDSALEKDIEVSFLIIN